MISRWKVVAVSVMTGTAAVAAPPTSMLSHARNVIAGYMTDPTSLQFRNLRIVRGVVQGRALTVGCGEYNSRNRMGGYVGFTAFAYEPTVMHGVISFGGDAESIHFFSDDGESEADHPDALGETNARILAVCLGLKQ